MAVNPIKRWRLFYARRRRELRPWMDIDPTLLAILLKEDGDKILLENNDSIRLE